MRHIPILLLCSSPLPAQVTWSNLYARSQHAMATDPARARMVVFGGAASTATLGDIWEFSSTGGWAQAFPDTLVQGTQSHTMAFWSGGAGGGAGIMSFGGLTVAGRTNRTLLWSGEAVTFGPPAPAALEPRDSHAMAFDRLRRKVLLFGGFGASGGNLSDTWEWDAVNQWVQRTPVTSPPPRLGHAMAFEPSRQRVLLFGGNNNFRSDTWEFDDAANTWRQLVASGNPTLGRKGAAMTDDGSQVLLFGGENASGLLNDTWLWDDNLATWVQLNPANRPPARRGHSIAYDSSPAVQAFVVLGGTDASGQPLNDSWKFRASNWTEHFPPPPGRHYPTLFADPISRRLVLFGGAVTTAASTVLGDTWEFDQDRWRQVSVTGPAGRYASASCWMSSSISALLFGGILGDRSINGETWSWNGAGWVQRFPAQSPPPLWGHGMAYDAARDRVVLFGGVPGSAVQNQTWEWDGTNWQQRLPQTVPPGRQSFGMAYDVARARVVIWGGSTLPGPTINDTWEWDGTDWTLRTTAPSATPAPGSGQMVYDASRRRCVLHNVGDQLAWEWDGQSWIRRTPTVSLPPRDGFAMAYDNANARVALVGGYFGSQHPALGINETWFYHPVRPATATERGAACPGSGGMPRLAPLGSARPWLDDSFPVQLTGVPTGSISILFIGASNSLWFNVPLPLPLQGFPGCSLHVSLDLGPLAFVSSQGISLPIPNSPALAGSHLYLQAFTIDTGVQGSITTSNALDLRLAGK